MIASSRQEDKIWKSSDASRLHRCITEAGFVVQISLREVPLWYFVPAGAADWPDRIEKTADDIIIVSPRGDGGAWTLTHGGRMSSKMQEDGEWQIAK